MQIRTNNYLLDKKDACVIISVYIYISVFFILY